VRTAWQDRNGAAKNLLVVSSLPDPAPTAAVDGSSLPSISQPVQSWWRVARPRRRCLRHETEGQFIGVGPSVAQPAGQPGRAGVVGPGQRQPAGGTIQYMAWDTVTNTVPLLLNDYVANFVYGPAGTPSNKSKAPPTPTRWATNSTPPSRSPDPPGPSPAPGSTTHTGQSPHTPAPAPSPCSTTANTKTPKPASTTSAPATTTQQRRISLRGTRSRLRPAAYGYAGDEPLDNSDAAGLSCNKNPLSGSFWTQGNCLSQPVQVVLDEGRAPDYYTFCVGASPFLVIPSGCLTATKHRHVLGSVQDSVGIPGGSAQSRAGWIDSTKSPSSCEIDNFVNGASASANGFLPVWPFPGVFGGRPAVSETWGLEGQGGSRSFGTEVGGGLGTHSGDVGQSRARHLFNF
jgi:hypothetical protein